MKNVFLTLVAVGTITMFSQSVFAWESMNMNTNCPCMSLFNPSNYTIVQQDKPGFSLNPFTGFKNCNKCKVKKEKKCDECTEVMLNPCPTCKKAFAEPTCDECNQIYLQPKCPCMIND